MAIAIIIPRAFILQTEWTQSSLPVDNLYKSPGTMIQQRLVLEAGAPLFFLQLLLTLRVSELPVHAELE